MADAAGVAPRASREFLSMLKWDEQAARHYMTSDILLSLAVWLSESIGHFQIEPAAFIPEVDVLDRRRTERQRDCAKQPARGGCE
jgi:hypothetical protein